MTRASSCATLEVSKKGPVMAVGTQPKPVRVTPATRPELRVIESKRRGARLHLLTYIVGNALFWTLWAAVSVSAEHWY